jgi:hypothetical protein
LTLNSQPAGIVNGVPTKAIAAVAALALVLGASNAAASPQACVPKGFETLRASGPARVYTDGSALFGCLGARTTRLGMLRATTPFPARRVVLYALSARYAGVDKVDMGVDTLASTVTLFDLKTGRKVGSAPATTGPPAAESFSTVTTMRVNSVGVLAWVGRRSSIGALAPVYELRVIAKGRPGAIAAGSVRLLLLALNDSRLRYRFSGGRPVSVPLSALA